ncbi:MAG: MurR/RpiR family transcriptional regulator [Alphaproteobacteria bacterium]|nr:MurR/RpiR family transcriptional regulator [Alphaproteobacteria bacterium]
MTLHDVVEQFTGRLTKADRKIVEELLANPREGAFLSLPELAERADVHPTSAVRLAQKLGYSGYPELRSQLQNDMLNVPPPAVRIRERLEHMSEGSLLSALVESEINALRELVANINQDDIERAAHAIIEARKVFLFGRSHAGTLSRLMALRLRRHGYRAAELRGDRDEMADGLADLQRDDLVIAFAFHRPAAGFLRVLRFAAGAGARTLVISDHVGATLRPNPDILLAASRGRRGESQSLTVPMAICNTLILEVSRLDKGKSLKSLEKLTSVKRKLRD